MEGKNGGEQEREREIRGKAAEKRIDVIERARENLRDRTNTRDREKREKVRGEEE